VDKLDRLRDAFKEKEKKRGYQKVEFGGSIKIRCGCGNWEGEKGLYDHKMSAPVHKRFAEKQKRFLKNKERREMRKTRGHAK
jgi:hypothetical protein